MTIELILAEDIPNIAKSGDTVILKDDKTFEIQKSDIDKAGGWSKNAPEDEKDKAELMHRVAREKAEEHAKKVKEERPKEFEKEYDPRIEKYLSIDKEKSWSLLTKFYNDGHLDSYKVLKDFINKIATCPDVTDKFEKIMDDWMRDGEADTSIVEKIIDSCKKEGGNVEKSTENPTQEERDKAHKIAREKAIEHAKDKKDITKEVIDEVLKEKTTKNENA